MCSQIHHLELTNQTQKPQGNADYFWQKDIGEVITSRRKEKILLNTKEIVKSEEIPHREGNMVNINYIYIYV